MAATPLKSSAAQRSGHRTGLDSDPVLAQDGDPAGTTPAGSLPADLIPMSATQNRRVHALISKARPGEDRHQVMTQILGRPITTARQLSTDDADRIVDALDKETVAGRGGDAA